MYQGTILEFLNMGGGEIFLIAIAILLLFGGKKLPELARGLGKGIREFKDASEGVKREIQRNINSVTTEEEEKQEEAIDHSAYHHPTEDQDVIAAADIDYNHSETEAEPLLEENHVEKDEQAPVKGKESHIE